jgi:hypothetical protein
MLLLLAAALASWVPMRWPTADPASLSLLAGTPINCLILEPRHWSPAFLAKAKEQGLAVVGLTGRPWDPKAAAGLDAILAAGPVQPAPIPVYPLLPRSQLRFNIPLVATAQGVWPGINAADGEPARAAPSGAPWIDTNAGFLRFARALTASPIWIANAPPAGKSYPVSRYLQVTAEAAMCGARWVIALDDGFQTRLLARDALALRDWRKLTAHVAFLEAHAGQLGWPPAGKLTLVQDTASGALLSGGILDMIAVKHTPVRPVPAGAMTPADFQGALMAVNVSPALLTAPQRAVLAAFAGSGGTVLTGPPDWRFPAPRPGQVTLDEAELLKLDRIWKEVNALTGRRNLGARLFNVGAMLSNLTHSPGAGKQLLHLVNYTDFPVESITAHILGKWSRATLHQPGLPPKQLETYPTEESSGEAGTGIDIPEMGWYAILELE